MNKLIRLNDYMVVRKDKITGLFIEENKVYALLDDFDDVLEIKLPKLKSVEEWLEHLVTQLEG